MKSTMDIRDILFQQMDKINNGKGDIEEAKTITELSAQAIYATRVEVENKKLELELGKATEEVKKWMSRDFSNIQDIKMSK